MMRILATRSYSHGSDGAIVGVCWKNECMEMIAYILGIQGWYLVGMEMDMRRDSMEPWGY